MIYLLTGIHVVLCIFLILVVLLQQGKGADLSVFGGGTSMTAFGARSATTLLHRLTVFAFVGFVFTTISIAYLQGKSGSGSVMQGVKPVPVSAPAAAPTPAAPAAPASSAPTQETPAETPATPPPGATN